VLSLLRHALGASLLERDRRLQRGALRQSVLQDLRGHAGGGDLLLVDLVLLVDEREQIALSAHRLRGREHEVAARPERVMEDRHQPALERLIEIDEHVPAHDEIELRERRIAGDVLAREDAHVAHRLMDAMGAVGLREEAAQALEGYVRDDVLAVSAGSRDVDGLLADVGGEDLEADVGGDFADVLQDRDRDRVHLLARGTAGDPDPNRGVAVRVIDDRREDDPLHRVVGLGIAEEARHRDQDVARERLRLGLALAEELHVALEVLDLLEHHPPPETPLDRRTLVLGEVDPGGVAQDREDLAELLFGDGELLGPHSRPRDAQVRVAAEVDELLRDHLRRANEIDGAGRDRRAGHAVVARGLRRLRDGDAAPGLDLGEPCGPVGTCT
jgi:hypothetical protein